MLNPLLTTFLTVADCGSFTSASKRLFISATAVMKQMDVLEAHLDLRLLERTPHGVRLTARGEMIARDARFYRTTQDGRWTAPGLRQPMRKPPSAWGPRCSTLPNRSWICGTRSIGRSPLQAPSGPFEDDHQGILAEIGRLGEKFDFLVWVCDSARG